MSIPDCIHWSPFEGVCGWVMDHCVTLMEFSTTNFTPATYVHVPALYVCVHGLLKAQQCQGEIVLHPADEG